MPFLRQDALDPTDVAATADPIARTESYLAAIEAANPSINAFVTISADLARQQAQAAAARRAAGTVLSGIDGWCIAVKDNIDVAGVRTTNGLPGGEIAQSDATVVARLRAAGAIILGKTNLHEAALGTTTNNPHWGATHNPHRAGFTAGGSSGGSAAAVAAGLCDAALGSDTMGSIRLPAAYCGVVGFKPSFERLPTDGVAPLSWALDHVGAIAPSVEAARRLFEALAGPNAAATESKTAPPRVVRLAAFERLSLEPQVASAYEQAIRHAERVYGACPIIETPGFDPVALRRAALLVIEADAAAIHAQQFDQASPALRKMLDYGAAMPAPKLALAVEQLRQGRIAIRSVFDQADLVLCPTTPQAAFALTDPAPPSQADFLGLAVFVGAPAISVPVAATDLPVGMQIISAPGHDYALLTYAGKFTGDR